MKTRSPKLIHWLVLFTFLTRIALAFRPQEKLTERPYQDDGYYALTCGYQLAAGHGYSIDGIHPTNGVQPLIIPLYALFFQLSNFDKWLGVRLTFILVALLDSFCVYALYRLSHLLKRDSSPPKNKILRAEILAPLLWAFLFQNLLLNACGLETGLYGTLIISSLWCYTHLRRNEVHGIPSGTIRWIFFGIVLGLMVLARIDGAIIVVCFAATDFFSRNIPFSKKILPSVIFCSVALLISSPWWIYNYSAFGSIMPISGQSEALGADRLTSFIAGIRAIDFILLTVIYIPYKMGDAFNVLLLLFFANVMFAANRQYRIFNELKQQFFLLPLVPLLIGSAILVIFYVGFFGAPFFLGRYFHPLRILWLLFLSMSVPILIRHIIQFYHKFSFYRKPILIVSSMMFLGAAAFNITSYILNFTTTKSSQAYHFGSWALSHPEEKIGLSSSGTAEFMADNIVNLDGKVNFEALKARKQNTLGEYIVRSGITILTDWDYFSNKEQINAAGAEFTNIGIVSGAGIYKRTR